MSCRISLLQLWAPLLLILAATIPIANAKMCISCISDDIEPILAVNASIFPLLNRTLDLPMQSKRCRETPTSGRNQVPNFMDTDRVQCYSDACVKIRGYYDPKLTVSDDPVSFIVRGCWEDLWREATPMPEDVHEWCEEMLDLTAYRGELCVCRETDICNRAMRTLSHVKMASLSFYLLCLSIYIY